MTSKFSKQHYEILANVIKTSENKHVLALRLAEIFQADNERFNFKKFAKASGIILGD